MQLQPNFYLSEFETSVVAAQFGWDNSVPESLLPNAFKTAALLQRIRDFLMVPVIITSGYRCAQLNRRVGGAAKSHHTYAAAADFIAPGFGSPLEICRAIEPHVEQWGIGQLIHEWGRWVHVGTIPVSPVNRILTIDWQTPRGRPGIHPAQLEPSPPATTGTT